MLPWYDPEKQRQAARLRHLREVTLNELLGRVWHTTHPQLFHRILVENEISPEPGFGHWRAIGGNEYISYARKLGGVSLFDFTDFDPDKYEEKYPLSSWMTFVPYIERWGASVWIEIDPQLTGAARLIRGPALLSRWIAEEANRYAIMPEIEAVHVGPLPKHAFHRAILVGKDDDELHELPI